MSKSGIVLDNERRALTLIWRGDSRYPGSWLVTIWEDGKEHHSFLVSRNQDSEYIARQIRGELYSVCSSSWLDEEFQETHKLIVSLVQEVRGFERTISNASEEGIRDGFFLATKGLKTEIQAAILQFLWQTHPEAVKLIADDYEEIGQPGLKFLEELHITKKGR